MATLPLLGQNRAYYIPNLMGGNMAPAAGTPALGESGVLRDIIANLLANFNPAMGAQRFPMSMDAGGSSISDTVPDAGGAGGEISVDPVQAFTTMSQLAGLAQTGGQIAQLTQNPTLATVAGILGPVAGAGGAFYGDAARDAITNQTNQDLEAAGLEGNYDLGRRGYDPSLAAAANIAPLMGTLGGAPLIGNILGLGLMEAADPVPSTRGDIARSVVDLVTPSLLNTAVQMLTGSTIGTNIKGAMTPVQESIARTPEEIARDEALGGRTAEGAPVETIVPTPVENIPPQDEATVNALIDAMAAASEPAPNLVGAMGVETLANDLNFADTQSVRGPDIAMEQEAMSGSVTPFVDPRDWDFSGLAASILADLAKAFSIPLNIGAIGAPPGGFLTTAAEPAAPPPAPPVAPVYGDSNYTVVPDLAPIEETNAIFNESSFYESSMGSDIGSSYDSWSADNSASVGGYSDETGYE
jgi:hypothetical protein